MQRVTLNNVGQWDPVAIQNTSKGACYGQSIEFINYLPRTVGFVRRDGVRVYPDYRPGSSNNYFLIRIEQRYTQADKVRIIQQYRSGELNDSSLASVVEQQWISAHNNNYLNLLRFEYRVTEPMLSANNNCIYLDEIDTVIAYDGACANKRVFYHPYSKEGYLLKNASGMPHYTSSSAYSGEDFIFHVRIIDNAKLIGDRWINFSGMVTKVKAVEDFELIDGVYIVHSKASLGESVVSEVITEIYDVSKIPYFEMYPSYAAAKNSPEFQMLHKEKMQRMEAESRVSEAQLKLDKAQQEAENYNSSKDRDEARHRVDMAKHHADMAKLQSERDKIAQECLLHELRLKAEKQKLENEILLLKRKNTGELLKYVPLVITLVVSGVKLFKK